MQRAWVLALALGVVACGGKAAPKKIEKPVETPVERPPPPPPPKPLTIEEKLKVHDGCFADFVAEVPEFFTRCYTATSSEEMIDTGEGPQVGTPAIAASTRPLWDAFKLAGEARMVLATGDNHVLTIALVRGTQEKTFQGLPPTGKTFGVFVAEMMTLDDQGRHAEVRNYVDLGGMVASLGGGPKGAAFRKPYELTGRPAITAISTGGETETINVAAVQSGFDKFNAKDWKGVTATYTDDAAIYEQISADDVDGGRAIGKYFAELGKAFPNGQQKVEALWGAGDFVVAESTFTGTNDGPLPRMGLKKGTKKAVTLRQAHVFRLDGGKVLQHWIFGNGLAVGVQLGLITPPAPPAAPAPATP